MHADEKWAAMLPKNAYGPFIVRPRPPVSQSKSRPYRGKIVMTQAVKPFVNPSTVSIGCRFTTDMPSMKWGLNVGYFRAWLIGSSTDIINAVCAAFAIERNDLMSVRRNNALAFPRFAAVLMFKEYTDWSFPRIGRVLQRDHTTIMHAHERARDLEARDPDFREKINRVRVALCGLGQGQTGGA